MANDSDESDYCYYGQAIGDEAESKGGAFRKPVQDQAATRALPIWQQEPTDEQGRKRFHGGSPVAQSWAWHGMAWHDTCTGTGEPLCPRPRSPPCTPHNAKMSSMDVRH